MRLLFAVLLLSFPLFSFADQLTTGKGDVACEVNIFSKHGATVVTQSIHGIVGENKVLCSNGLSLNKNESLGYRVVSSYYNNYGGMDAVLFLRKIH